MAAHARLALSPNGGRNGLASWSKAGSAPQSHATFKDVGLACCGPDSDRFLTQCRILWRRRRRRRRQRQRQTKRGVGDGLMLLDGVGRVRGEWISDF